MIAWILNNWLISIVLLVVAVVLFTLLSRRRRSGNFELKDEAGHKIRIGGDITVFASPNDDVLGDKVQEKPEWHEVLEKELDRLQVGKVVFNPPEIMRLGVKERVETRISSDLDANLVRSLKGRGLPQIEELKISKLMKVRLSGDDFDIISLNEEEQIIEATGFTEWAWDVTPRKSGKKILHLHVTLRIRLPFGEEKKDHPVLDREILVQVNLAHSVKSFIVTYWKWIMTALMLPLIDWIWKTYIK